MKNLYATFIPRHVFYHLDICMSDCHYSVTYIISLHIYLFDYVSVCLSVCLSRECRVQVQSPVKVDFHQWCIVQKSTRFVNLTHLNLSSTSTYATHQTLAERRSGTLSFLSCGQFLHNHKEKPTSWHIIQTVFFIICCLRILWLILTN